MRRLNNSEILMYNKNNKIGALPPPSVITVINQIFKDDRRNKNKGKKKELDFKKPKKKALMAHIKQEDCHKLKLYLDSGASVHITKNSTCFKNPVPKSDVTITAGNKFSYRIDETTEI